jgi:Fe-S cluster assembly scaffold protein SufB
MRKVYLDADNLDLMLVPTQADYEFVFIQTEGKCTARITLTPEPDTKFKVKIYIYAEGTSEVDCTCTLKVPKDVNGVETDIQIRSWPFDKSKIKARPEMFIANSDIVATHGNALGNLKSEDKYYLASRGISDYKELVKQSLINA